MINTKKALECLWNDAHKGKYSLIAVSYNPQLKDAILKQGYFNEENSPSDINFFSKIITSIFSDFEMNEFFVRLNNTKFSWLPSFILKESNINSELKRYLDGIEWKSKPYFGKIKIHDLNEFYRVYFDYPIKYSYQDIIITPLNKACLMVISHHGEVWIISDDDVLINEMANMFIKNGATVIRGNRD